MGAWIEILISNVVAISEYVAPLVGAWIEIPFYRKSNICFYVAPLVGAWIEIFMAQADLITLQSLPSWERGLK